MAYNALQVVAGRLGEGRHQWDITLTSFTHLLLVSSSRSLFFVLEELSAECFEDLQHNRTSLRSSYIRRQTHYSPPIQENLLSLQERRDILVYIFFDLDKPNLLLRRHSYSWIYMHT